MAHWHNAPRRRGNVVTIETIWLAILLSLLVHLAALWEFLPQLRALSPDALDKGNASERLEVRLAKAPGAPPPPAPPPQSSQPAPSPTLPPSPRPKIPPPKAPPRLTAPPVMTAPPTAAGPSMPRPSPTPAPPVPTPPSPPAEGDLASFIAARRRSRGDPEPSVSSGTTSNSLPSDSDIARRDRIVAANLGSLNSTTFGADPKNSGGIFQLRHIGYDDAEFSFFGWNKEIGRRTPQVFEVRKGNNSGIRIAVVRKMIAIIREYEQEDFTWNSRRLGKTVTLSARATDNAGLEDFMMQEFFAAERP